MTSIGTISACARRRGRRRQGQAIIEFALVLPLILLLVMASFDVGRNVGTAIPVQAIARAGMLDIMLSDTSTTLSTTITRASSELQQIDWGLAFPGSNDDCAGGTHHCGDPNGCVYPGDFWNPAKPQPPAYTGVTPIACFAVGSCTVTASATPTCLGDPARWDRRIPPSGDAIVVRVVVHQSLITPLGQQLFPTGIVILADVVSYPAH